MSFQKSYDELKISFRKLAKASLDLVQIHEVLQRDHNELIELSKEEVKYAQELKEEVEALTEHLKELEDKIALKDSAIYEMQNTLNRYYASVQTDEF